MTDPPTPFQETAASLARSRDQLKQICDRLQCALPSEDVEAYMQRQEDAALERARKEAPS